jgi:uncharacterized protein (UPF0332 family)
MSTVARELWDRARKTLESAQALLLSDPDNAASRAYYAAFHAVSALFALEDRVFTSHAALNAAVHRDLVKTGRWPRDLGADYSLLQVVRQVGDYGGPSHVSAGDADKAIRAASRIVEAVRAGSFPG